MSSTIPQSDRQVLQQKASLSKPNNANAINRHPADVSQKTKTLILLDEKRGHFTRTSSLERLRRFNAFICTQHYYIIFPALLHWLKSSKRVLETTLHTGIFLVKNPISNLITRSTSNSKLTEPSAFFRLYLADLLPTISMLLAVKFNAYQSVFSAAKRAVFVVSVYATVTAIFAQLALCLYALTTSAIMPFGLIFLITCIYLITHINLNVLIHMSNKETCTKGQRTSSRRDLFKGEDVAGGRRRNTVIKPKQLLCNRTISNVNLF